MGKRAGQVNLYLLGHACCLFPAYWLRLSQEIACSSTQEPRLLPWPTNPCPVSSSSPINLTSEQGSEPIDFPPPLECSPHTYLPTPLTSPLDHITVPNLSIGILSTSLPNILAIPTGASLKMQIWSRHPLLSSIHGFRWLITSLVLSALPLPSSVASSIPYTPLSSLSTVTWLSFRLLDSPRFLCWGLCTYCSRCLQRPFLHCSPTHLFLFRFQCHLHRKPSRVSDMGQTLILSPVISPASHLLQLQLSHRCLSPTRSALRSTKQWLLLFAHCLLPQHLGLGRFLSRHLLSGWKTKQRP